MWLSESSASVQELGKGKLLTGNLERARFKTKEEKRARLNKKREEKGEMYKIENSFQLKNDILHRPLEGWAKEEPEVNKQINYPQR